MIWPPSDDDDDEEDEIYSVISSVPPPTVFHHAQGWQASNQRVIFGKWLVAVVVVD